MTIESREKGRWLVLICDCCGEKANELFTEFRHAVAYKKEHEWKSQKRNGEWEDICPDCKEGKI